MANKVKNIRALSAETAREITQTPENWMRFLDTASRVYKYPFHEQMLIYAQRPDAIACASIEVWNKNLRRWVNRGSKGIALLDDSGSYLKLKYVFDFTDTHPGYQGLVPFIWKMETSFHEPVLSHLEDTYNFGASPSNLPDALLEIGKNTAAENYPDYLEDFRRSVSGSFLSDLDDLNLELLFRRTLTASVQYTLLKRCGFDPEDYLSREDFADIHSFNTVDTLSQVGFAVNETARPVLIDIGREIRSIILGKLRDYPLADPQRMPYNEFITLIRESKEKGGPSNEQSVIQDNRGLPDPGTDHREAADKGKYGMMRRTYLKQHRGGTYQSLLLSGQLNEHLQEIDQTAQDRIELLMDQLLENEPAPEKEKDPIGWAAHMNMLHQIAEETVLNELIYS